MYQTKTVFEDENFELYEENGVNIYKEPYHEYRVRTKDGSRADKWVIEVRINSADKMIDGINEYQPRSVYVSYGMRGGSVYDNKIEDYIAALKESLEFADKVAAHFNIKNISR